MKEKIKNILKNFTPPFFYNLTKRLVNKSKIFNPIWNTLDYDPLKGVKIFFDPTGHWQKKMITGTYDTFLFNILKKMNLDGKVIFDIGSHIGFHSFYFSRLVGKKGKVYAFEPHPKNIDRLKLILKENEDMFGNISVYDFAVSDKNGTEEFNLNEDIESGRSSGNFIESADTFWERSVYTEKGFHKTVIKTLKIDSIKDNLNTTDLPDIMKIDVEGAEYLVLLGAKEILIKKSPILFIEIHSMLNMYNVITFLYSLSYKIEIINTERNRVCFIKAEFKKN